jgi:hypothetical protein
VGTASCSLSRVASSAAVPVPERFRGTRCSFGATSKVDSPAADRRPAPTVPHPPPAGKRRNLGLCAHLLRAKSQISRDGRRGNTADRRGADRPGRHPSALSLLPRRRRSRWVAWAPPSRLGASPLLRSPPTPAGDVRPGIAMRRPREQDPGACTPETSRPRRTRTRRRGPSGPGGRTDRRSRARRGRSPPARRGRGRRR